MFVLEVLMSREKQILGFRIFNSGFGDFLFHYKELDIDK